MHQQRKASGMSLDTRAMARQSPEQEADGHERNERLAGLHTALAVLGLSLLLAGSLKAALWAVFRGADK